MATGMVLTAICNVLNRIDELGVNPVVRVDGEGGVVIENGGSNEVNEDGHVKTTFMEDIVIRLADKWTELVDVVHVETAGDVINIQTNRDVDFQFKVDLKRCDCYFNVVFRLGGISHQYQVYLETFDEMIRISNAAHAVFVRQWIEWGKETSMRLASMEIETHVIVKRPMLQRKLFIYTLVDDNQDCVISVMITGLKNLYYNRVGKEDDLLPLVQDIGILRSHTWVPGGNGQ